MIFNINQLRGFYLVAKYKSIKLAAQELMVTPPAVAKQVKQLEEMVEMKLIFRDGNSLKLTKVGQEVFNKSSVIFNQVKEMEVFFNELTGAKSGVLRIGCPPTAAKYIMPALFSAFRDKYPSVKIVLSHGSNSEVIQSIFNQQNELAIFRPSPSEKRLKLKVFRKEEVVLITAQKSKSLPVDEIGVPMLSKIPLILPNEGSAIRDIVFEYYRKLKEKPFIALECNNIELIKEFVINDQGVSFLPQSYVWEDIRNKKLRSVHILANLLTTELAIGYLKRQSLSQGAWAFFGLIDKFNDLLSNADNPKALKKLYNK